MRRSEGAKVRRCDGAGGDGARCESAKARGAKVPGSERASVRPCYRGAVLVVVSCDMLWCDVAPPHPRPFAPSNRRAIRVLISGLRIAANILTISAFEETIANQAVQHPAGERIRQAKEDSRLFGRHAKARHLLELPADAEERGVPVTIGETLRTARLPHIVHRGSQLMARLQIAYLHAS